MDSLVIAHQRLHNQKLFQTTFTKPDEVVAQNGQSPSGRSALPM
jgi:hypothetical protein